MSLKGTFEIVKGLNIDAFYSLQGSTNTRNNYYDKNSFWVGANTNGMTDKAETTQQAVFSNLPLNIMVTLLRVSQSRLSAVIHTRNSLTQVLMHMQVITLPMHLLIITSTPDLTGITVSHQAEVTRTPTSLSHSSAVLTLTSTANGS